jgi:hypothetical protein
VIFGDGERRDAGGVHVVRPLEGRVHRQLRAEHQLPCPCEPKKQFSRQKLLKLGGRVL